MAQNIKLRRTNVPGRTGNDAGLTAGELAMNTLEGRLWGKGNNVFEIITETRVVSPVTEENKVVTQAELQNIAQDYDLPYVTYDQNELPASQSFYGDGVMKNFVLSSQPSTVDAIDVYVNDVLQRPDEVFYIIGTTLTFGEAPPSGSDIYIKYRYPFATIVDNPDNSIENRHLNLTYTSDQFTSDGDETTYDIQEGHTVHDVLVIINGLIQPPTAYTISGSTLTLSTKPMVGSVVDFRYLPV